MKIKTPSFWYRDSGAAPWSEKILTPFSWLYRAGYEIHQHSATPEKFEFPILCIGNINAGGTGKTPVALALMEIIRDQSLAQNPFFLLRGYGGGERGPLVVDPYRHNSWITGDEALILAARAPTVISVDRVQGALLAARHHADLILMDDGLQNPGIHKDIKIVVINGDMGFGNGRMLPAGPLREPLRKGLTRADLFILIGEDKRNIAAILPPAIPLIHARLEPTSAPHLSSDKKYLAFAGLGYPEKFFSFLEKNLGLRITDKISFPDHYPYTEQDLRDLHTKAESLGAELLTTPKDYLRLPKIDGLPVHTSEIRLVWDNKSGLAEFLKSKLSKKS